MDECHSGAAGTSEIQAGETCTINARESEFRIGDRVPLDRVANKLPISLRWKTVARA
jgi:hypothetical protein